MNGNDYIKTSDMHMLWKIMEMFLFRGMDGKMQSLIKALKFDEKDLKSGDFVNMEEQQEKQNESPKLITPQNIEHRVEPSRPLLSERLRYLESVYKDQ